MATGNRTIPYSKPTGWLKAPKGLDVEAAHRDMIESAEAAKTYRMGEKVPSFIEAERAKSNRGVGGNTPVAAATRANPIEDFAENAIVVPPPANPARQAATPAPAVVSEPVASTPVIERVPVQEPEPQRKRIEEKKFVVEIFKENKEWVAELTYKNGSGTETFKANSKDELLAKLAVGKAHGTIKVRETVQRYKLGDVLDTWDVFFNEVKASHGLSLDDYNALPEASRQLIQDNIQAAAILEFKAIHTNYYAVAENFQKIGQYLNSRKVPLTLHNLEIAYRDLSEDDLLEVRPAPQVPPTTAVSVNAQVAPPETEDSAMEAEVVSTPSVTVAAPVRKRGLTGLEPGRSSASPATEVVQTKTEESSEQRELSMEEARRLARENPAELARLAKQGRKYQRY